MFRLVALSHVLKLQGYSNDNIDEIHNEQNRIKVWRHIRECTRVKASASRRIDCSKLFFNEVPTHSRRVKASVSEIASKSIQAFFTRVKILPQPIRNRIIIIISLIFRENTSPGKLFYRESFQCGRVLLYMYGVKDLVKLCR